MESVVFRIGNGKVVHYGTRHSNGVIESACHNSYADERNKDTKEYSSLEEITCKTCYNHKEWYVRMDRLEKESKEKAKTYKLEKINELNVGDIYKERATPFHFSGKYALTKAKVLSIENVPTNDGGISEQVVVAMLNSDLEPVKRKLYNGDEVDLVNNFEVSYFKERFLAIKGNVKNA